MLDSVEWLGHSALKISKDKIIYIDPYLIKNDFCDADIIFITHSHYDHFSEEDIQKCKNDNTKIVITSDLLEKTIALGFNKENILCVTPNNFYEFGSLTFETIPAYNTDKNFHPRENNWVGYIINIDNTKYYITGDTDIIEEAKNVICDVLFLPIGGVYTMNYEEASTLTNEINPKIVVPIHYGTIVGTIEDAIEFKKRINVNIECQIMK